MLLDFTCRFCTASYEIERLFSMRILGSDWHERKLRVQFSGKIPGFAANRDVPGLNTKLRTVSARSRDCVSECRESRSFPLDLVQSTISSSRIRARLCAPRMPPFWKISRRWFLRKIYPPRWIFTTNRYKNSQYFRHRSHSRWKNADRFGRKTCSNVDSGRWTSFADITPRKSSSVSRMIFCPFSINDTWFLRLDRLFIRRFRNYAV